MIRDRLFRIFQAEMNDWLGKHDQEKNQNKEGKSESFMEDFFEYFTGKQNQEDKQNNQEDRRERAYRRYQEYRQKYQRQQGYRYEGYYYGKYRDDQTPSTSAFQESSYYQALEVSPGAGFEEIKNAYKTLMKKYHPDRFAGDAQKQEYAQKISQRLNEAYEYFKNKFGKK